MKERTEVQKEKSRSATLKYYHANKEASAVKAKAYYLKNKEYVIEKQRLDKRERKLKAIQYLGNCCIKCNEKFHPAVYEFHHKDPLTKDRDPSKMLSLSWLRLQNELDKCILVCANCHRLIHHGDKY